MTTRRRTVHMLVDALVIRILGARAWWLPRWLDRGLPTVPLERDRPLLG